MDRKSPAGGNNYASNNYHDLTPRRHDNASANNKAHLANDTNPAPRRINPRAVQAQGMDTNSSSYTTQTNPLEPELHLRGGSSVDYRPDDDERPSRLLWWFSGGMGPPPTFGELRYGRRPVRSDRTERGSDMPSDPPPPYDSPKPKRMGFFSTIWHILTCGRGAKKQTQESEPDSDSGFPSDMVPAYYPTSRP
ncbi:hypothetical protein GX51_04010 [Blastomyces parvus]|uniref:Uncharacterized protein n=1 Tax=Blastomyces parvus TaxID=2060905 RepID=A0A2B7WW30_9EURO|nr:hypothetical protein GX51_04010 [Blastomyces parvus]